MQVRLALIFEWLSSLFREARRTRSKEFLIKNDSELYAAAVNSPISDSVQ